MGKRVLRQTMLAIAVIYGSDLYKKCTPFDDIFQLFKMDRGVLSRLNSLWKYCSQLPEGLELQSPCAQSVHVKPFCIMDQTLMSLL